MILDGIFNGGGRDSSPSEPPSGTDPATGSEPTKDTAPAESDNDADPIYDEEPGDIDDGTYADSPPAEPDNSGPVEAPAENTVPSEDTDTPASSPDETPPVETPTSEAPAETAPDTAAPARPGKPQSEDTPAEEGVRDFVTPLLADIETIRQRQSEGRTAGIDSARQQSRDRAVAALQDQLASRLVEGMTKNTAPSPLEDAPATTTTIATSRQPLSLVNRWYAEA